MNSMETIDLSLLDGEPIRRMRRVEYEQLAKAGHFEDERVELLFGVVVPMAPIDPAHVESTHRIADRLRLQLGARAYVRIQAPFAASEWSEPEPDVFAMPPGEYWDDHPDRAYLVVEVSRSSLRRDRGLKAKLYARASVEEYWIVDHVHQHIEVLREPRDGIWHVQTIVQRGDVIEMRRFPDVRIAVAAILPPV
jgi:Uma2 family endonuclease